MGRSISAEQERMVAKLLGRLSTSRIAQAAGVSRRTVMRRKRRPCIAADSPEGISREMADQKLHRPRCPTCGSSLAEIPCRLCAVRKSLGIVD